MSDVLNQRVEVRSISGGAAYQDVGNLVACDERWIQVQTSLGAMLFFPIANVRLVKPLK